jgi:methionyl-tRNA synthetase
LVGTWGNLAHRALTFTYGRFDGCVPTPGQLDEVDSALLQKVEDGFDRVGELLAGCSFRAALGAVMDLAREANRYLEEKGPWFQIKEDRQAAGTTMYVALKVIDSLKILFAPFLPFSSERLHHYLGYDGQLFGDQYTESFREDGGRVHEALCYDGAKAGGAWRPSQLSSGQGLREPEPLFEALDESVIEEERARLEVGEA